MNNILLERGIHVKILPDELMSVKLLFNRKEFSAQTCDLNNCLLSLQRQKCSSLPATEIACVWN